jgi:hypothetical protein
MPAYAGAAIALVMPGHDLEGDAGGAGTLRLPRTAPEHERVAALQAHDLEGRRGRVDEQRVDLLLRHRDATGRLADVDELGRDRREARANPATRVGRRRPRLRAAAARRRGP